MVLFNHTIGYRLTSEDIESDVCLRVVDIDYDDAFGARRHFQHTFLADRVARVQVGGTAMSSVDVYSGVVVSVDKATDRLMALCQGNVFTCVHDPTEGIKPYDRIKVVEHLMHTERGPLVEFDWLATKRETDFRLNSVRVILFDKDDTEVGVISLDPYLPGRMYYGYSRA